MTTFTAQINAWSEKAKRNALSIAKQSTQDLLEIAQTPVAKGGNMPVLTGELRNSLISSFSGSSSLTGPEGYVFVISNMDRGGVFQSGWTAPHARAAEYGDGGNRKPRYFVRGAAQQWQRIVAANAAKLKD